MLPNFKSGIEMLTAAAMISDNTPSPSTDKDTRDASNHDNAPSPIQTPNSPNSSLNNWEITPADPPNTTQHLNTGSSQENAYNNPIRGLNLLYEVAMQHDQCLNKTQDYSDTNKTKESTRKTANQAPVIFIEKKTLQHNSPPSNSEESKTYVCNYRINTVNEDRICGKQFLGEAELTKHMEIHTKRKNHVCRFCERIFDFPSFLDIHERIHTGDKPFVCKTCGKAFSRNSNLTQHILTHTGEKNFVCAVCDKEFSRNSALTKHIKTHTKNE